MELIERIKVYFYQRSLPARPARSKGSIPRSLDEVKRIGLIFDATEIDNRKQVLRYAESLRKQGKSVELLGYIEEADKEATFSFSFYTAKHIDWARRPKGETITQFLDKTFDAYISLFPATSPNTEQLALHCSARLKIGPVSQHPDCYDIMLDMPAKAKPQQIIQQYEAIFAKSRTAVTA